LKKKYELSKDEVIGAWGKNHPKVMTWLAKLQRKTNPAWFLWIYCKTTNKTPDELLTLKKTSTSNEAEYLLDTFVADQNLDIPNSVKVGIVITVKSFYKHNYCDLAKASGQISFTKQKPYRRHTKEELVKIYRAAHTPRDRALITFTWSTSIAKESLTKVKWSHLDSDWETQEIPHISLPSEMVKGHGIGKYKGVEQHTFLTPEAKRDLLEYKDWLERVKGVKVTSDCTIFTVNENALSKIAMVLGRRSGVPFGWHDARRYVETALEETKINPNWARKIRGRKVRGEEAPYSRPAVEQLRRAYSEAVPLLEFTQQTQLAELQKRQDEIEEIVNGLSAEQKEKMERYGLTIKKRLGSLLKKRLSAKQRKPRTATNGGDCGAAFEQITEAQLLSYLKAGWSIVEKLGNGEVIVNKR